MQKAAPASRGGGFFMLTVPLTIYYDRTPEEGGKVRMVVVQ